MNVEQDWITTLGLMVATLAGGLGSFAAIKRVCCAGGWERPVERGAVLALTGLSAAVFGYRALVVHADWVPLQANVDGLALLAGLLGLVILYVQWTGRLRGMELFAFPVVTLVALWGICASWWSLKAFDIGGVWSVVHLIAVYLGTLAVATAAAAGAMYLFVDRQMRRRDQRARSLAILGRMGDLESIEQAIIRSATIGFLLVSLGLATGLVIVTGGVDRLGAGWWHSPKVVLAGLVWMIFAVVMHVRFVPNFRGRRAAALSIVGFVLMIGVLVISQALPGLPAEGAGSGVAGAAQGGIR